MEPGPATGNCSVTLNNGDVPVCCEPNESQRANIDEVFRLLNEYRQQNGRAPLTYDYELEAAMQGHCQHMAQAGFFSHYSPVAEIQSPWARAERCGTKANGENIASRQKDPAEVMASWKKSSDHNRNMLSPDWKRVGIGEFDLYWGQIFGQE
jgi:uncharacterized protein YkwD